MAREEQDREDLLAEAKALIERISLRLGNDAEETVVGFRRDGSASVFFGPQPVYQLNSQDQLRRAFADGLIYKAEAGRLVALRRQRTEQAVELVRRVLNDAEAQQFVAEMHRQLDRLQTALGQSDFALVGQVPETTNVVDRVRQWIAGLPPSIAIAPSPRVR